MELYDREKIGAYIQTNYPDEYGPCARIRLLAEEGPKGELLASVLSWPADLYQPTPDEVAKFTPPPKVDLTAQVSAALDAGKLGATATAKATAALTCLEALTAALKAKGVI